MQTGVPYGYTKSNAWLDSPPILPKNTKVDVKPVAFYLPQFHPIPKNDEAWGKGFTEWTNVNKGFQQFSDHHQPRVPADFGYYDLRNQQIQVDQCTVAKDAGLAAFCYYYYWFNGEKPLEAPILNHRDNNNISLPYLLCFANENWTKRWDGLDDDILYEQKYSSDFADFFYADIREHLLSKKYLRDSQNRPILLIYRPSEIENLPHFLRRIRSLAKKDGLPGIHLMGGLGFEDPVNLTKGLDSYYEFPPLFNVSKHMADHLQSADNVHGRTYSSRASVYDYRQFVVGERIYSQHPAKNIHPAVTPDWDNTARRHNDATIFCKSSPHLFYKTCKLALKRAKETDERLFFINAWNEWAEGAYLEPDKRYGWAYLNAFSSALSETAAMPQTNKSNIGKVLPIALFVHVHYLEVWQEFCETILKDFPLDYCLIVTTSLSAKDIHPPKNKKLIEFQVITCENRGRDILPFLTALKECKFDYDIALKLHTKKSLHRSDGDTWRRILMNKLIGDPEHLNQIVDILRVQTNIGMVAPNGHLLKLSDFVGSNLQQILNVSETLGIDFTHKDIDCSRFSGGSMFWFRKGSLDLVVDKKLMNDFPKEEAQVDGTPAHALERLFGQIVETSGFVICDTDSIKRHFLGKNPEDLRVGDILSLYSEYYRPEMHDRHIYTTDAEWAATQAATAAQLQEAVPEGNKSSLRKWAAKKPYFVNIYRASPELAKKIIRRF